MLMLIVSFPSPCGVKNLKPQKQKPSKAFGKFPSPCGVKNLKHSKQLTASNQSDVSVPLRGKKFETMNTDTKRRMRVSVPLRGKKFETRVPWVQKPSGVSVPLRGKKFETLYCPTAEDVKKFPSPCGVKNLKLDSTTF